MNLEEICDIIIGLFIFFGSIIFLALINLVGFMALVNYLGWEFTSEFLVVFLICDVGFSWGISTIIIDKYVESF